MITFFKLLLASSCILGVVSQGSCSESVLKGTEWKNPMFDQQSTFNVLHIPDGSVVQFSKGTDEETAVNVGTGVVFGFSPIDAVLFVKGIADDEESPLHGNTTLRDEMIGAIENLASETPLEAFCFGAKKTESEEYRLYMSPLSDTVKAFEGEINIKKAREEVPIEAIFWYSINNLGKLVSLPNDAAGELYAYLSDPDAIISQYQMKIKRRTPFEFEERVFT